MIGDGVYLGAVLQQLLERTCFVTLHFLIFVGGFLLHDFTDSLLSETLQKTNDSKTKVLLVLKMKCLTIDVRVK